MRLDLADAGGVEAGAAHLHPRLELVGAVLVLVGGQEADRLALQLHLGHVGDLRADLEVRIAEGALQVRLDAAQVFLVQCDAPI